MVNARLEFENGCIAHVTASRISPRPKRRLRVWAPEGYAGIDFVSRKLILVQASPELRQFGLRADRMDAAAKARLKDELFGRHLQVLQVGLQEQWIRFVHGHLLLERAEPITGRTGTSRAAAR